MMTSWDRTGSEPVGLVLADDGRIALVGNSNRGLVAGTGGNVPQTVAVIDTAAALAHRPAVLGTVPAGVSAAEARVVTVLWDAGARKPLPFAADERTRLAVY